jgi:FdhD protein
MEHEGLTGTVQVGVVHLQRSPFERQPQTRTLVEERPLVIEVPGVGRFTIMRTPGMDRELSVGFLFSEGIIESIDDIAALAACPDDPDLIRASLAEERTTGVRHDLVVSSSGGLFGRIDAPELVRGLGQVSGGIRVCAGVLFQVSNEIPTTQALFKETGSTHAAALFDQSGAIKVMCEDIGRHNAVDKVLGQALLTRMRPEDMGLSLSGRASLDLIVKAARSKVGLVVAVGGPSAQAVDAAKQLGMTLCGFVRRDGATVYTHDWRVK